MRSTCWLTLWIAALALVPTTCQAAAPDKLKPAAAGRPPKFRQLAPGVETAIDPQQRVNESFSRHDIPELLQVDPGFEWAKDVVFRHDVRSLQMHFKPLRYVRADVPQADGSLQPTLVWYLVYRITNETDQSIRFVPQFELVTHDLRRVYPDRIIPAAIPAIGRREDPLRRFQTTAEIAGNMPAGGESAWGVATWTDVDLRSDRFSIYVAGLTNAYRWKHLPDGSRSVYYKTLKLNFWRPGDELDEHESEIRLGGPGELDYTWVYR